MNVSTPIKSYATICSSLGAFACSHAAALRSTAGTSYTTSKHDLQSPHHMSLNLLGPEPPFWWEKVINACGNLQQIALPVPAVFLSAGDEPAFPLHMTEADGRSGEAMPLGWLRHQLGQHIMAYAIAPGNKQVLKLCRGSERAFWCFTEESLGRRQDQNGRGAQRDGCALARPRHVPRDALGGAFRVAK